MTGLHKEVYGQGEPVVMLHGWAMHTGIWRNFSEALAINHQLVCLDLPGHGLSETLAPYTLDSVVDAVVRELPEQRCVLVGWSLGGNIALRLAEKYPQRIKSLVLIASNPHFIATESWAGMQPQVLNQFMSNLQKNPTQALQRFISLQVQGKEDTKSSLIKIKASLQECALPTYDVLMSGLYILQTADLRRALKNSKCPVQMILGELDTLVPVRVGEQCQLLQPNMALHVIAGAGHIPFIAEQQEFLALMQDFIQRAGD